MTHFVNILLLFKLPPHQMLNATVLRLGGHTKTEQTGKEINCLTVYLWRFALRIPATLRTSTPFYSSPEAEIF